MVSAAFCPLPSGLWPLPSAFWPPWQVRYSQCLAAAIEFVRDDRVPQVLHVDAKLMGSAGFGEQPQFAEAAVAPDHLIERDRLSGVSAGRANHHLLAHARVHADVRLDPVALQFHAPPDDRPVFLAHFPALELPAQPVMDLVVLGNDQYAARVAVEPVHDPSPRLARDITEAVEVELQGGRQRSAIPAPSRVDDHPGRLVDHSQPFILIEHTQRNVFRGEAAVRLRREPHRQHIVDPQPP